VVIATVVVARFYAPPLQVRPTAVDGLFTVFYGLNYRLAIEGTQYLHQGSAPSPLLHFWSLGVEEQFYVFWPMLVLIFSLVGRRFRTPLLFVGLLAIAVVSYHYSITVTESSAPWAYFSLHTRAWELALGCREPSPGSPPGPA
jgi:peptidoglycan/LPS O-acetylase OafA/YrhL